jgi:protein O-mannosyl-transferase
MSGLREVVFSRRTQLAALVALALLAMGTSLQNGWVQDDPPLVSRNPAVHQWSGLTSGFVQPYWPAPSEGGLYRPLARSLHTLVWMTTGGSLIATRLLDLLLYVALTLSLFALARALLAPGQAWIAAALFAVHPVHVEAVAVAVNQGELIVGIAASLAAVAWLQWMRGTARAAPTMGLVTLLYLVALGFKEHALVLPALLGALEVTIGGEREGRRLRWGGIAALFAVGAAWWTLRASVLGSLAGAAAAEGLNNVGLGARALTMLGVAGEWTRLFFWPARQQGDYSPWEIAPWSGWASEQTAGLFALLAFGIAFGIAWRRQRAVAFGLLWIVIGLAPVANLIFPTGIFLAERTLLLATVGLVIAVAGAIPDGIWDDRRWRTPAAAGVAVLLLLGAGRSALRMGAYRTPVTYLASLIHDAPDSWRTMVGAGIAATESGDKAAGERLLVLAHRTWPASPRPIQVLAFYYRLDGACGPAVPLLVQALRLRPADRFTRLPLVACLLDLGRYAEAREAAVVDTIDGTNGRALADAARAAAEALRTNAPPHTVRLAPVPGGLTLVGPLPTAAP